MNDVRFELLDAGYCVFPEHVVHRNWHLGPLRFPALFALIEHPREGVVLFDTGYSQRFFEETRRFPNRLYRLTTPVTLRQDDVAVEKLAARGISPEDVRWVICSHFHADHVGALKDFPRARFLFLDAAWRAVRDLRGFAAVRHGVLPGLFPDGFAHRAKLVDETARRALPAECAPFQEGFDVLGDGTLLAVELPGHAHGQIGLVLPNSRGIRFLVADACWTSRACREQIPPHPLTRLLFADYRAYGDTLRQLGELWGSDAVEILPSHCLEVRKRHVQTPISRYNGGNLLEEER